LRHLGFSERDVRRALADVSQSNADREQIESLLRRALARLTAPGANS
jgi:Holliday junction resolvasome RuvABC DNA-binding subunit